MTYEIIRFFAAQTGGRRVIERGLTLEEAQAHCSNPETSSSTCTTRQKRAYTEKVGQWFDGYTKEGK